MEIKTYRYRVAVGDTIRFGVVGASNRDNACVSVCDHYGKYHRSPDGIIDYVDESRFRPLPLGKVVEDEVMEC